MNVDARISVSLPAHPKTKKLIRRGGQGAAWNLVCLFLWVSQNKPSGDLSGMSSEDIEIASGWEGEEGQFVKHLSEVGFLDGSEGEYAVHDWEQHNPWACGSERRSENSRIAARKRWGIAEETRPNAKAVPPATAPDASPMRPACDPHATGNADSEKSQSPVSVSVSDTTTETKTTPLSAGPTDRRVDSVKLVFDHWRIVMGHPQAKLGDSGSKRYRAIAARLKDGYTPEQLKLAVEGCKKSPHHMGKNDRGEVYDDLELICRDQGHVDKFLALGTGMRVPISNGNGSRLVTPPAGTEYGSL